MLSLIIRYDKHAIIRVYQRSCHFGIDAGELFRRVNETVIHSKISISKTSNQNKVYYRYYYDNLSVFVFCKRHKQFCIIKTVIIKEGRE